MRDYKKKQGTNDVAPTGADKGDKLSGKKRSAGKATGKSKSVEKKVVEKIAPKPRATPKTSTKKSCSRSTKDCNSSPKSGKPFSIERTYRIGLS